MEKCGEIIRMPQGIYNFVCYHCQEIYETGEDIIQHIENDHFLAEQPLEEDNDLIYDCQSTFDEIKTEYEYVETVMPDQNATSNNATQTASSSRKANALKSPYECDTCQQEFSTQVLLFGHKKLIHNEKGFLQNVEIKVKCKLCNEEFSSPSKYRNHMKISHNKNNKSVLKEEKLSTPKELVAEKTNDATNFRHKINYSKFSAIMDLKGKKCLECNRTYSNATRLRHHINLMHISKEKKHVCNICGHKFREKNNLRTHMRKHTGEKPYKCGLCHKSFVTSSYLNIHQRFHDKVKPYQCSECGKTFFMQSGLTEHIKKHTNARQFKCSYCPLKFLLEENFTAHEQKHLSGIFQCKICSKTCNSISNLRIHIKLHDK